MDKKTKLIFNRKIALQLSRLGFPIIDIIENHSKKSIDIYVFENTENFRNSFTSLVEQGKFTNKPYWRQNSNDNTKLTITTEHRQHITAIT